MNNHWHNESNSQKYNIFSSMTLKFHLYFLYQFLLFSPILLLFRMSFIGNSDLNLTVAFQSVFIANFSPNLMVGYKFHLFH